MRLAQLERRPWCECPHHQGKCPEDGGMEASVVDHIEPHRGDTRLFFNPLNLQSMSYGCHNSFKQSQEKGGSGFYKGAGASGDPSDASHPWFR